MKKRSMAPDEQTSEYSRTSGKTTIAPDVLITISRLTTLDTPGVYCMGSGPSSPNRLFNRRIGEGVQVDISGDTVSVDLYVVLSNDVNIREVSRNIQFQVARSISEMVGMQVGRVNVHIEDIYYPAETDNSHHNED